MVESCNSFAHLPILRQYLQHREFHPYLYQGNIFKSDCTVLFVTEGDTFKAVQHFQEQDGLLKTDRLADHKLGKLLSFVSEL